MAVCSVPLRAAICSLALALGASPPRASGAAPDGPPVARTELWAGRYVFETEERLPVVGTVKMRSERLVLATVVDVGHAIELVERPCSIRLAPVAGVTLTTRDENARTLPAVKLRYLRRGAEWHATPWRTFVGRDGPPLEVEVRAPLCGTKLQVASETRASARAQDRRDGRRGLEGLVRARALQRIQDSSGACLGAREHRTDQRLTGRFTFVAVDPTTTCASLGTWPEAPSTTFALGGDGQSRAHDDYGERSIW
jgi:hypothetical protein